VDRQHTFVCRAIADIVYGDIAQVYILGFDVLGVRNPVGFDDPDLFLPQLLKWFRSA
jgi:hypothetical protein